MTNKFGILFRHIVQKFLDIRQYACEISVQSAEKSDCAICARSLCGIAYMLKQAIDLSGVGNARELGGYTIGDKKVKKGVLLRTAGLNNTVPEAIAKLQNEYWLQTVIDFRMTGERLGIPDREIPCAQNLHLPVIEMEDYSDQDPELIAKYANGDIMMLFEMSYDAGMLGSDIYVNFLLGDRGKRAYREFFRLLLEHDPDKGAILWHCTDGKENEYLVGVLTDGRCFGEIGLLTGKPSPFSVVAVSSLMVLGIGADDFEGFITEEPKNAADIMRDLAGTVVTMGTNVNLLKEEMLQAFSDKADDKRVEQINRSILKYKVSGMQGSPYFSKLT